MKIKEKIGNYDNGKNIFRYNYPTMSLSYHCNTLKFLVFACSALILFICLFDFSSLHLLLYCFRFCSFAMIDGLNNRAFKECGIR